MKILLVICAFVLFTASAEKPAPYPPKGWKPQGARLEIPPSRAYGAPLDAKSVEFTTASSATESFTPRTNDDDFLSVQGLAPSANAKSQFQNFQQQRQSRILMAPAPAFGGQIPILLSRAFAPQFAALSQQLHEEKFGQQQQEFSLPKQQYGVPSNQYGPPEETTNIPQNDEPELVTNENESEEESDETSGDNQPVIAISNASSQTRLLATTQQGQFGQYYVLLPDNSLQKVRYATGQNEDDRSVNGFSAQLKYSPVEPIKDPVFGYDEQGKLVRLFK
ncbi:hypothetical protein PVAND_004107 [Polypedilum vanderplanki]|uniref:DUF4794 domain-containing protein n=1 Tax=Polypedilum vanderplanki TaxID=319348 RepID=A0A9J6BWL2_POLVA|nr:hypothetical protein PVAND_004107 [Polypedilum vanderplanki]